MNKPRLSFEFFPPRTATQSGRFWRTLGCLETLRPEWVSVTYGALGSASQASIDIVSALQKEGSLPVAAHLTCFGQQEKQLNELIDTFVQLGVDRFVALRGDIDADSASQQNGYQYAIQLVELLAARGQMDISVAAYPEGHPEAASVQADIDALKAKFDAGASRALTQFFFDADLFLRWRDQALAAGIEQPLIPGILPIHDIHKVMDFSARCGASVPQPLIAAFASATTPESQHALALEQAVELCQRLHREGVDDFHLYTLNQSDLAYAVGCVLRGVKQEDVAA